MLPLSELLSLWYVNNFTSHKFECTSNFTSHRFQYRHTDLLASNSNWSSTLLPHTYLYSQSASSFLLQLRDWLQNFTLTTTQQPTLCCHCQSVWYVNYFTSHKFECTYNFTSHRFRYGHTDLSASNSSWTSTLLPHTYLHSQSAASILLSLHDWLQNLTLRTSQQPTLRWHCQSGISLICKQLHFAHVRMHFQLLTSHGANSSILGWTHTTHAHWSSFYQLPVCPYDVEIYRSTTYWQA